MAVESAQTAGHRDPGAGHRALDRALQYTDAAVACRSTRLAGTRGQAVALSSVRPDAGDAVDWLGDDFGGRGSGDAQQLSAPAVDCRRPRGNFRLLAQGPSVSGVSVFPDHPHAPGGGTVSRLGQKGR
nr:hypothetical protein [Tanacetum cinerariifolium]